MRLFRIALGAMAVTCVAACGPTDARWERDVEQQFKVHTGSDKVYIHIDEQFGYASASGVWTIEGDDKIADPINTSDIFCDREDKYCEDHRATIVTGLGPPTLMADSDLYKVTLWSADKVVATLTDECRTIQLEISPAEGAVTQLTRGVAGCTDELRGQLPKPRLSRLISGKELDKMRGIETF